MIIDLFGYILIIVTYILLVVFSTIIAYLPGIIKEEKELAKALEKERREREFRKMINY